MADETITFLFLQHEAKCILLTGIVRLIPTSANQVRGERACPQGQGKESHCFRWRGTKGAQAEGRALPRHGPKA